MQEFIDLLFSNNVWVLVALIIIFLLSLSIVLRRFFGFVLTIFFIVIALGAGFIAYNHETVQDYLHKDKKQAENSEQKKEQIKKQIQEVIDWINSWISEQKEKPDQK